jgi:hypothetical protein
MGSFIEREMLRVRGELVEILNQSEPGSEGPKYALLYAAQQALAWVLEATGAESPYDLIMANQEEPEDCWDKSHPPQS